MAKSKQKTSITVKVVATILCVLALGVGFIGAGFAFAELNRPESDVFVSGDFEAHFLELGNIYTGDCIYIRAGDNDILIDAGSREDSADDIIEYVDQYVTDGTLEFVIATHADRDHIAAFEDIFKHYKVETIIDFPQTNKVGDEQTKILKTYYEYRDKEVKNGAKHYTALECYDESKEGAKRVWQLSDGVEMEILYNYYYGENADGYKNAESDKHTSADENNYSVCLMFNQGDNHYLFTGDLEGDGELNLLEYYDGSSEERHSLPQCVLYKAGHHGSKTSTTKELMEVIQPQYVVVCCCAGTPEYAKEEANKFPTQAMIDNVAPYTDAVYIPSVVDTTAEDETSWSVKSMNGNIIFACTNGMVSFTFSNNNLKLKDTEWFRENRDMPAEWTA